MNLRLPVAGPSRHLRFVWLSKQPQDSLSLFPSPAINKVKSNPKSPRDIHLEGQQFQQIEISPSTHQLFQSQPITRFVPATQQDSTKFPLGRSHEFNCGVELVFELVLGQL